jgi:hypothetical protein
VGLKKVASTLEGTFVELVGCGLSEPANEQTNNSPVHG